MSSTTVLNADYTIIIIGIVFAVIFFAVQLLLCFKAKKTYVKLIPTYINFLFVVLIIADLLGMFDTGGGFIPSRGIAAIALSVIAGIAFIGEAAAWILYAFKIKKRKSL